MIARQSACLTTENDSQSMTMNRHENKLAYSAKLPRSAKSRSPNKTKTTVAMMPIHRPISEPKMLGGFGSMFAELPGFAGL